MEGSSHHESSPGLFNMPAHHFQEEAFAIWSDWALCYRPGSEERGLLESVQDRRWLVSIVHHDYKDAEALWNFLFDGSELI